MRLSAWKAAAPHRDATSPKVMAMVDPVLAALGAEPDPVCWIVWGDDPRSRWSVLAPSLAGLILLHVRVNVPQEGPRSSGKLVRWNRVQVGELAIETAGGHRLLSFQVEGNVLRGSDGEADAIAEFARQLFAAIDGRPFSPAATPRGRAAASTTAKTTTPTTTRRRELARLPAPKGKKP